MRHRLAMFRRGRRGAAAIAVTLLLGVAAGLFMLLAATGCVAFRPADPKSCIFLCGYGRFPDGSGCSLPGCPRASFTEDAGPGTIDAGELP